MGRRGYFTFILRQIVEHISNVLGLVTVTIGIIFFSPGQCKSPLQRKTGALPQEHLFLSSTQDSSVYAVKGKRQGLPRQVKDSFSPNVVNCTIPY